MQIAYRLWQTGYSQVPPTPTSQSCWPEEGCPLVPADQAEADAYLTPEKKSWHWIQHLSLCCYELKLKKQMHQAAHGQYITDTWCTPQQLALIMKWSATYDTISAVLLHDMATQEGQLVAAVCGTLATDQAVFDTLPNYTTY